MKRTSLSPRSIVRVALLALTSFGAAIAFGAEADAQPRHRGPVVVTTPRGSVILRRPRFYRPAPRVVYAPPPPPVVQPAVVIAPPPPPVVQPAVVVAPPPPPVVQPAVVIAPPVVQPVVVVQRPVVIAPQPAVVVAPPPPPPPSDANGIIVMGDTRLAVGQPVRAAWGAGWFDAQVTAIRPDGNVRIHYTGYGDNWDEDVPRHRIRLPR